MQQRLLVEGETDFHVITHLLLKRGFDKRIKGHDTKQKYADFVIKGDGKKNALKKIPITLQMGELSNVGIILDADKSAESTYQSLKDLLAKQGYNNLPKQITKKGFYQAYEDKPNIGIWIMPNNQEEGYLEHFLYELIPDNDDLTPEVEAFIDRLITQEKNLFSIEYRKKKAEFYTWLALQESPEVSPGFAIKHNYFNVNKPLANDFITWFETVFELND